MSQPKSKIDKVRKYCERELELAIKHSMPYMPIDALPEKARRVRFLACHLRDVIAIIDGEIEGE